MKNGWVRWFKCVTNVFQELYFFVSMWFDVIIQEYITQSYTVYFMYNFVNSLDFILTCAFI